jgi:amino acid adenylation domain-containing protein
VINAVEAQNDSTLVAFCFEDLAKRRGDIKQGDFGLGRVVIRVTLKALAQLRPEPLSAGVLAGVIEDRKLHLPEYIGVDGCCKFSQNFRMDTRAEIPSIINEFLARASEQPAHLALSVDGQSFSYAELLKKAEILAGNIPQDPSELIAVFAYRSPSAYAMVIAAHLVGRGYLPLNPQFPLERTQTMLELSESNTLIVAKECLPQLEDLLIRIKRPLRVVLADSSHAPWMKLMSRHQFIEVAAERALRSKPMRLSPSALAYVLFTSGSTGTPKGVMITHANLHAYVGNIRAMYAPSPADRFSQVHDFTFDPSAHDMFSAWSAGACLCVLPKASLMGPAKFIAENKITVWYSVPSVASLMLRMKMLGAGAFPDLRVSLFCGEPLPMTVAEAWQRAAPRSSVDNFYGPTEATVSCTTYRWDSARSPGECENGIVPIGKPFEKQKVCLVNEHLAAANPGELCLAGPQVSPGYWRDPARTAKSFTSFGGETWYRTGDLVEQRENGLYFLGRLDSQVKIRGYRVELQEIEHQLKVVSGSEDVAAVAWPVRNGAAEGVTAFLVAGERKLSAEELIAHCRKVLPEYMVPARVIYLEKLPLNANGKIDRKRLCEGLGA